MGAYQSKPSTEKSSCSGYNEWIEYGVSSMQGWRMNQEDAHNCELEFDQTRHASLFAVYDGHGGSEVAQYCATYLPQFLRNLPSYAEKKDLSDTLKQLFLDFDASLITAETRKILRGMSDPDREDSRSGDDAQPDQNEENDDEEESDSEISALRAEANQPLESVLERYGGEDALPSSIKDLLEYRRRTKVGECSTSSTASSSPTASTSSPTKKKSPGSPKTVGQSTAETSAGSSTTETAVVTDSQLKAEESKKSDGTVSENSSVTTESGLVDSSATNAKNGHESGSQEEPNSGNEPQEKIDTSALEAQQKVKTNGEEDEEDDDSDDESVQLDEDEESDSDDDDEEEEDEDDDEETSSSAEEEDGYETACRLGIPALLKEEDSEPGMDSGTTACVALVLPMNGKVRLYVANAGDSRAVLCRGRAAVDLSVDHKPEDEDEKARIETAGGTVTRDGRVNGGLNLSRALGDHNYKQVQHLSLSEQMITPAPDVSQYDLIPGADEFVVIACDGVWNSMTSQEVVDFVYDRLNPTQSANTATRKKVAKPANSVVESDGDSAEATEADSAVVSSAAQLSRICEEIFDHCLAPNTEGDGTGCDNMTCIIIRFKNLEALAKHTVATGCPEPIASDTESRKRPPSDDANHQNNNASPNGHATSVRSSESTDTVHVKRLRQDSKDHPTTATTVSNGQSS